MLAVNLKGTFLAAQAALRPMKAQGSGRMIFTSSITGPRVTSPGHGHYSATKAGINGFIRAAALEFAGYGITVNGVEPGNVLTESVLQQRTPEFMASMVASIPLGRLAAPRDVANAFLFLASDEAAYITGTTIVVDGGQTLPEGADFRINTGVSSHGHRRLLPVPAGRAAARGPRDAGAGDRPRHRRAQPRGAGRRAATRWASAIGRTSRPTSWCRSPRYQMALGASGITVQKLGEAEVMADAGISDLLLTFNIVGAPKLKRLADLARRTDISVVADHADVVAGLADAGQARGPRHRGAGRMRHRRRPQRRADPGGRGRAGAAHRPPPPASGYGGLMTYPRPGTRAATAAFLDAARAAPPRRPASRRR